MYKQIGKSDVFVILLSIQGIMESELHHREAASSLTERWQSVSIVDDPYAEHSKAINILLMVLPFFLITKKNS